MVNLRHRSETLRNVCGMSVKCLGNVGQVPVLHQHRSFFIQIALLPLTLDSVIKTKQNKSHHQITLHQHTSGWWVNYLGIWASLDLALPFAGGDPLSTKLPSISEDIPYIHMLYGYVLWYHPFKVLSYCQLIICLILFSIVSKMYAECPHHADAPKYVHLLFTMIQHIVIFHSGTPSDSKRGHSLTVNPVLFPADFRVRRPDAAVSNSGPLLSHRPAVHSETEPAVLQGPGNYVPGVSRCTQNSARNTRWLIYVHGTGTRYTLISRCTRNMQVHNIRWLVDVKGLG